MASQLDIKRRALHIMVDALASSGLVLDHALEDVGASFSTMKQERDTLISIAMKQAENEAETPHITVQYALRGLMAAYGEPTVSLAWAEMIGEEVGGNHSQAV